MDQVIKTFEVFPMLRTRVIKHFYQNLFLFFSTKNVCSILLKT